MMSSSTRSIITFQIGNYSNHIGAHWFNSQMNYFSSDPEADRSIFWNERLSWERQRLWTPRLLLFDLGSNWPKRTGLSVEELERTEVVWDGAVNRVFEHENEKKKPPASVLEHWGDYLEWKLGGMEKVSFPLSNFTYNSSLGVLSNFEDGVEIFSSLEDRVTDGIRCYAEECDHLEGFHLLVDQDDGFGGIGSGILSHIEDEYEKKSRLVIGTSPATSVRWADELRNNVKLRLMNSTLAWSTFNNHSSLFTSLSLSRDLFRPFPQPRPLSFLNYEGNSSYESSAILATALDTLMAPYFTQSQPSNLTDLVSLLNAYGRKMTTFGLAFPLNVGEKSLYGCLREHGSDILQNLSPGGDFESSENLEKAIGNYFVIRGVPNENVMRQSEESPALRFPTSKTCLDFFSREIWPKSVNVVRSIESSFKVSHPFPTEILKQTFLATQSKSKFRGKDSWSLGVLASAHNSPAAGHVIERLVSEVDVVKVKDVFQHRSIELDDYIEAIEGLKTLREAYLPES